MIFSALKWLAIIGVALMVINQPGRAAASVHHVVNKVEHAASGVSTFLADLS